jgi:hypothetical protein
MDKTIEESFSLGSLPDNSWVLEFKKSGEYEYFHWSGFSGVHSLEKGKYGYEEGILRLQSTEKNKGYQRRKIPRKLFYTKMSKKEFEDFDGKFFAYKEKKIGLKKVFVILSKKKINL